MCLNLMIIKKDINVSMFLLYLFVVYLDFVGMKLSRYCIGLTSCKKWYRPKEIPENISYRQSYRSYTDFL